jgi:hypothetical protein
VPTIFISYRRSDATGEARELRKTLARELPQVEVFRDIADLPPGVDFGAHIDSVLQKCDLVLVLIGKTWLAAERGGVRRLDDPTDWPRREIASALAQKKRVIPVLLYGTEMPAASALPDDLKTLASLNAAQLSDKSWDRDVADLVASLRRLLLRFGGVSPQAGSDQERSAGPPVAALGSKRRPATTGSSSYFSWALALGILAVGLLLAYYMHWRRPSPPEPDLRSLRQESKPDVVAQAPGLEENKGKLAPAAQSSDSSAPVLAAVDAGQVKLVELKRIALSGTERRLRYDLQASADGTLLASSHSDNTTRIVSVATGAEVAAIRGASTSSGGTMVRFAPDGRHLAIADRAGLVNVVQLAEAKRLTPEIKLGSALSAMTFVSPNDLLVAGNERVLALLTLKGQSVERSNPGRYELGDSDSIGALFTSADGKVLAVADARGEVRLTTVDRLATGEVVGYAGSGEEVRSVLMSIDGKRLAWLSRSQKVTVVVGPDKKRTLSEPARHMIFTGDGRYFVTSAGNVLRIYDFSSLTLQGTFRETSGAETLFLAQLGKTPDFAIAADSGAVLLVRPEKN